jgi:hypothetical protein
MLQVLDESMPEDSSEPDDVIKYLADLGEQGLIGGTSRRFLAGSLEHLTQMGQQLAYNNVSRTHLPVQLSSTH